MNKDNDPNNCTQQNIHITQPRYFIHVNNIINSDSQNNVFIFFIIIE